ncbi:MAG: Maf-like protein [Paludibacteraceae bacterium]
MLANIQKYRIILGSQSPRRKELLKGLNIDFEVKTIDTNEDFPPTMVGVEIPMYLARKKADTFELAEDELLITADTIVWLKGEVFGKPENKKEAKEMLKKLSGQTHQVITGVSITTQARQKTFHVISEVHFAHLNDSEIDYYVENFNPLDKAGAYGVQEWIGYVGVERIEGSYFNVMGLPVQRLYNELKHWK